jgi:hypothetical protein
MDFVDEAIGLLGLRYDSAPMIALLSRQAPHKALKPSGFDQYVTCKPGGFDLLFIDRESLGGGRPQDRRLKCIFLYNEGVDGHRRFAGVLPFGFSFDDGRSGLLAKRQPTETLKIGEGHVPADHPDPSMHVWAWDGFEISAHYRDGIVRHFQIGPQIKQEAPIQKPPAGGWRTAALDPARKLEAIQLYRMEHGVGMADAKAAITDYLAQQRA